MGLFQKIRAALGFNAAVEESESDMLDKLIAENLQLQKAIELEQSEFHGINEELDLKLQACNKLIEKGNKEEGENNKKYIEAKIAKATDAYVATVEPLINKRKEVQEKQTALEAAVLKEHISIVARLENQDQEIVKSLIEVWDETGIIRGQEISTHIQAICKAVEIVRLGEPISKGGEGSGRYIHKKGNKKISFDFSSLSEEEYNKVIDKEPLKDGENYFIRYTSDPKKDLERGTSVHGSDFKSLSEARKSDPDADWVKLDGGGIGQLIGGLAGFQHDVEEEDSFDDTIDSAEDTVESHVRNNTPNTSPDKERIPVLFKGKYVDGIPDGDVFKPISIVKLLGYKYVAEIKKATDYSLKLSSLEQRKEGEFEGHYANAIVKNSKGQILFLKRALTKVLAPGQYCLPGGHIDAGETIQEACIRELKEEAGLTCNHCYLIAKAKCGDNKWAFYLQCSVEDENVILMDGESAGMAWMNEDEWKDADLFFDLKDHLSAMECCHEEDIDSVPTLQKAEDYLSESEEDLLIKGKPAGVGEKRTWGGVEYVKTQGGKWIKTKHSREAKKKDESVKRHSVSDVVAHAENTSTEQLEKIAANHKDAHIRDAAKREIERRNESKEAEKRKWDRDDKVRAEDKKDAKSEQKAAQKLEESKQEAEAKKQKAEAKKKADEKKKEEEAKPVKIKPGDSFSGKLTLLKNTEKAPNMGARFGQDVEPAGFYAIQKESDHLDDHPSYKTFDVDIKNPLIVDVSEDVVQWKRDLAKQYKAKGEKLSAALKNAGYDSIITTDKHGYTGEIIVLNTSSLTQQTKIKKSEGDNEYDLQKAGKHYEYVKVQRDGKIFYQYREIGTDKLEDELPVGDHVDSDESLGLKITKYSDKSFLITGDTYKNLELLRKLKADAGFGVWNKSLNGWIFASGAKEKVMSALISQMPDSTFEETKAKEQATQMKNAIDPGSTIEVDGKQVTVDGVEPTGDGVGYKLGETVVPEENVGIVPTNDATELLNNATEENRFATGKELFGKEEGETSMSDEKDIASHYEYNAELKEFDTRSGEKVNALDYTGLKQNTIQLVDQDGIMDKPKPHWCPDINFQTFAGHKLNNFLFDYVKMGDDKYLLALNGFEKQGHFAKNRSSAKIKHPELAKALEEGKHSFMELERPENVWGNDKDGHHMVIGGVDYKYDNRQEKQHDEEILMNNHKADYAVVSMDQIVAMQDYYQKFAKGFIARKKQVATDKVLARVKEWDQTKIDYYYPFSYEKRLSEKQKKKWTKEEWEALPKDQKIAEIPNMKSPAVQLPAGQRISQVAQDSMWMSNFEMYKKFVDKGYKTPKDLGRHTYTLDDCVKEYQEVRDAIQWRKSDLQVQREENDASFNKALQTSYGPTNMKDDLLDSHGVRIKRQNGKDIKADEVEQIKSSLNDVYGSFGDRSSVAKKFDLKISHSGEKYQFASKAIGMYVPSMRAIGVSNNLEHGKFGFTLAHEFAHFMDHYVGSKGNRYYASDNLSSTAGKIADTFRKHMNQPTDSMYLNRTAECFARALEQYHAMKSVGEDAIKSKKIGVPYHESPEHVSKENFNKHIKPLIEQFLTENNELLKGMMDTVVYG